VVFELTTQYAALGLATFRVIVGAVFVKHAMPKLENPHSTREFFRSVDLPDSVYLVYLALGIEIVAGTLLAIGLYTQYAALILTVFMFVATYVATVKMDKDFKGGYEVDILLLGACFMYYLNGAGQYAVDALV